MKILGILLIITGAFLITCVIITPFVVTDIQPLIDSWALSGSFGAGVGSVMVGVILVWLFNSDNKSQGQRADE